MNNSLNDGAPAMNDQLNHKVYEIARELGIGPEAALSVLSGLKKSGGKMVQFDHPELGGMGQWSSGMLMIGDMSNSQLKAKVQILCDQLSLLAQEPVYAGESGVKVVQSMKPLESMKTVEPMKPMEPMKPIEPMKSMTPFDNIQWWPKSLGVPSSAGSQNHSRYAYFPATKRLAIEQNGKVTVFDTGAHQISGVSQSQGDVSSLTFDSQLGRVSLSQLPEVTVSGS